MAKTKQPNHVGNLTHLQKAAIVDYKAKNNKASNESIAAWAEREFKLSKRLHRTSIGRILKKKHQYNNVSPQDSTISRIRIITNSMLERALVDWVLQMEFKKIRLSSELIKAQGKIFAQLLNIQNPPKFSNG